ncbi:MAG: gluconate 2-dehydrogenase subunit 3 family protein [Acidobacteria bacterium]|nr:gluconate 2-dehydrogenase subunit 3 family protein [Acidobacteriota bacterium]MDA1236854.1 gluconate 2-dehydrogenase subunit 3 family protein [Acidobacteriota bacterium]
MSKPLNIDRREMIKVTAGSAALVVFPPASLAAPQQHAATTVGATQASSWQPKFFTPEQNELTTALAELILPETDTPGAREAKVNEYIDLVLSDEISQTQKDFLDGLAWMNRRSKELFQTDFLALSNEQQTGMLTRLSDGGNIEPEDQGGRRFFLDIRRRTVFGYYTSKIGIHEELEYKGKQPLPEWIGCPHPGHHGDEI